MDDLMTPMYAERLETRWEYSALKAQLERGVNVMRYLLSPFAYSLMVRVLLVWMLSAPFLIVKAGVMPAFSRFNFLLG